MSLFCKKSRPTYIKIRKYPKDVRFSISSVAVCSTKLAPDANLHHYLCIYNVIFLHSMYSRNNLKKERFVLINKHTVIIVTITYNSIRAELPIEVKSASVRLEIIHHPINILS